MVRRLDLAQARATPKDVFSWRWWAFWLVGLSVVWYRICGNHHMRHMRHMLLLGFADFWSEMFGIIWSLASRNGYWLLAPNHIAVAGYESHELQPNSKTH